LSKSNRCIWCGAQIAPESFGINGAYITDHGPVCNDECGVEYRIRIDPLRLAEGTRHPSEALELLEDWAEMRVLPEIDANQFCITIKPEKLRFLNNEVIQERMERAVEMLERAGIYNHGWKPGDIIITLFTRAWELAS
jgi:hypothetical protein